MEQQKDEPGRKFDDGKCRLDLIPFDCLWELAKVYSFGAQKYADHNWRKGMSFSRIIGAILRHIFKYIMGESKDPETNCHHLAHAVWGMFTLMSFDFSYGHYAKFDDRQYMQTKYGYDFNEIWKKWEPGESNEN